MKILVIKHNTVRPDTPEEQCLTALTKDSNIELIRLGYPQAPKSAFAASSVDHRKIEVDHVNATDPNAVAKAATGMDFVVDMVEPWMSPYVKKGALQANVSYINPKENAVFWQKFIEGKRKLQHAPTIVSPVRKSFRHRKHI